MSLALVHGRARAGVHAPEVRIEVYLAGVDCGWDDDRICPNGLLGHVPSATGRTIDPALARAIAGVRGGSGAGHRDGA